MSSNTDIEELRQEIDKIWNIEVSKSEFENMVIKIAEIVQQKVIEAKIEQSWRCRELIEANASSPYDDEKYGEIVLLDIDDLKDELSQLNHNKKGDSDERN